MWSESINARIELKAYDKQAIEVNLYPANSTKSYFGQSCTFSFFSRVGVCAELLFNAKYAVKAWKDENSYLNAAIIDLSDNSTKATMNISNNLEVEDYSVATLPNGEIVFAFVGLQ